MSQQELALLRGAAQAVAEGLISSQDYDVVKVAFLRAQQMKAGLDAGFIRSEDYDKARDAYLNALDFSMMSTLPSTGGPSGGGVPSRGGTNGGAAAGVGTGGGAAAAAAAAAAAPLAAAAAAGGHHHHHHHHHSSHHHTQQQAAAPAPPPAPAPAPAANNVAARGSGPGVGPRASGAAAGAGAAAAPAPGPGDVPQYSRNVTHGKVSMAGIGVAEDCVNLFMHMKAKSAYKWVTFRIDDSGKTVIPDLLGGKTATYDDFVASLAPNDCRYGVYDYEYASPERGTFSKIVFINWAPDDAPVKTKMMYAATKDFFKGFLDGAGAELQASDFDEVSEEEVRARVITSLTRK